MRLRVATLNVWAVPLFSERIGARMREVGRQLAALELDVIAFQEVWTPRACRHLIEAGRSAGLVNAWHRKRFVIGSGLLVLSRLPIEGADFDRFVLRARASAKDELLGGKGFARVVLRTPAGPLTIVDTHLHAGSVRDDALGVRAHRTAQIVQLAEAMRGVADPLLVVGDLNFEDSDPEYQVLRGLTELRDLAAEAGCRAPTALRSNPYRARSPKGDRRIDYAMARDGADLRVRPVSVERVFDAPFSLDGRPGACSDHAGVLAEVEMTEAARSRGPHTDVAAIELAARLLQEGARTARRDRWNEREQAGIGLVAAAFAETARRAGPCSRRRFLRDGLSICSLTALPLSLESSLSSEWLGKGEIKAFGEAGTLLAQMRAGQVSSRRA